MSDARYGEPIGANEAAGLAVAFKALVLRAGGRVTISDGELRRAEQITCRVNASPAVMIVEVVDGAPPDVPRFAADQEPPT